jgi:hypothetical protein
MEHAKSWTPLSQLVGAKMPVEKILAKVCLFDRREGLFTLCKIASDLANSDGGITGPVARSWTHDLLVQRVGSQDPFEDAVSRAVAQLGQGTAIVHGHVLFLLQFLIVAHGSDTGTRPHDGELAFLMLALNDHIPEWSEESPGLSTTEEVLGSMLFSTIFNQTSDDPLRFMLRITEIIDGDVEGGPISASDWARMQVEAFGCSFSEYAERFLVPVFMLSRGWGSKEVPVLAPAAWEKGETAGLYRRWFQEASASIEERTLWKSSAPTGTGLLGLPGAFFRTPFVRVDEKALCFSPWHVKDHASLGTWAKLNAASKTVLGTGSNQRFTSTFGYLFERWCALTAREAAAQRGFKGKLLLPSSPGSEDEIEDVVIVDRGRVVLFSAKSSLVPEASLKSARSLAAIVEWLQRFFFEDKDSAKATGYRAGVLLLLDAKIQRIRAGEYEDRGIAKNALVIPVVVSFDNVGECGILYKWVEAECARRGILSARPQVRPLTVLTPEDYEAMLALGSAGKGTCDLLVEKTRAAERWGRTDAFLHHRYKDGRAMRLPGMIERFDDLTQRSLRRMREGGLFADTAEEVGRT